MDQSRRSLCFLFYLSIFFVYPIPTRVAGCQPRDISITQDVTGHTGDNIAIFSVEIANEASETNGVFNVKIACGDFRSIILVNPNTFKKIAPGVCLLKNGGRIREGELVSFKYAQSTSPIKFSVISLNC